MQRAGLPHRWALGLRQVVAVTRNGQVHTCCGCGCVVVLLHCYHRFIIIALLLMLLLLLLLHAHTAPHAYTH
jgi:hypothetical protein